MDKKITVSPEGRTCEGGMRAWKRPLNHPEERGWDCLVHFKVEEGSRNIVRLHVKNTTVYVEIDNLKRMVQSL